MFLLCERRDRLWAEFDVVLRRYLASVRELANDPSRERWNVVQEARSSLDQIRACIHGHCEAHGCSQNVERATPRIRKPFPLHSPLNQDFR
jgi:hypothetical protein